MLFLESFFVFLAFLSQVYGQTCLCSREFVPVCGPNGQTYPNRCTLNCAGYSLFVEGMCSESMSAAIFTGQPGTKSRCACNRMRDPVCGKDRNTYGNPCLLDCAGVEMASKGPCRANEENVDVVDGPSEGGMARSMGKVISDSACGCHTREARYPYCVNGVDYNGECLLECAGYTIEEAKEGKCAELGMSDVDRSIDKSGTGCGCSREMDPYCLNGKQYGNKCLLECAGKQGVDVSSATKGKCPGGSMARSMGGETCDCPKIYIPVCGSDGNIYNNNCLLDCAGIEKGPDSNCKGMVGRSLGLCACPKIYDPVCDLTNMKTYNNKCLLGCEAKTKPINDIAEGTCEEQGQMQ